MTDEKTEVQIFQNAEFGTVRSALKGDEPWFVAKDVAVALGYKDTSDALRKHVDDEDKLTRQIADSGQRRKMYIINESGLYALIFGSQLENAKKFKRWVTSEVLPAIRKAGNYTASPVVNVRDMTVTLQKLGERVSALEQSAVKSYAQSADSKARVIELVKKAAKVNGCADGEIWWGLYKRFEKASGLPVIKSAKAMGMSVIAYIDKLGRMDSLVKFAEQLFWFV